MQIQQAYSWDESVDLPSEGGYVFLQGDIQTRNILRGLTGWMLNEQFSPVGVSRVKQQSNKGLVI